LRSAALDDLALFRLFHRFLDLQRIRHSVLEPNDIDPFEAKSLGYQFQKSA
jgi:hypothetical protein